MGSGSDPELAGSGGLTVFLWPQRLSPVGKPRFVDRQWLCSGTSLADKET